ncbi:hypothetical protein JXQ31_06890 [candidate division KSB1 bacterium]|nr:hypothetical protein [candidate division KSB1 bacterium]
MTDLKKEKKLKITEIKNLIHEFCVKRLNKEYEKFCFRLCDALGRKRNINIMRSSSEQWAASIIYEIARLNFLFDKENDHYITADEICDFYHTKKSTTGNKATQIEKLCNLSLGAEGYCTEEITDMFTYYETDTGFIIPKSMVAEKIIDIQITDELIIEHLKKYSNNKRSIEEQREREKKERLEANKKKAEKRNKDQLGLFDIDSV